MWFLLKSFKCEETNFWFSCRFSEKVKAVLDKEAWVSPNCQQHSFLFYFDFICIFFNRNSTWLGLNVRSCVVLCLVTFGFYALCKCDTECVRDTCWYEWEEEMPSSSSSSPRFCSVELKAQFRSKASVWGKSLAERGSLSETTEHFSLMSSEHHHVRRSTD